MEVAAGRVEGRSGTGRGRGGGGRREETTGEEGRGVATAVAAWRGASTGAKQCTHIWESSCAEREERVSSGGEERMMRDKGKKMTCEFEGKMDL